MTKGLKLAHFRLISEVARCGGIQAAADALSISQPAASRMLATIERLVGGEVHRRSGRGIELTEIGLALSKRGERILCEVEDADKEVQELISGHRGEVRIGAVAGAAIEYCLPLIQQIGERYPGVSISVVTATSADLGEQLSAGELDFYIGRLVQGFDKELFDEKPISVEPIALIVGRDHPLTGQRAVESVKLLAYDWVLPMPNSLLRVALEAALRDHGLPFPKCVCSTPSFLLTLSLVQRSSFIAPVALSVANQFAGSGNQTGPVYIVDTDFRFDVETYSIIKQRDRNFSPVLDAIYRLLFNLVKQHQ